VINQNGTDQEGQFIWPASVEFYLYPTVGTVLIHSIKPELTEYRTLSNTVDVQTELAYAWRVRVVTIGVLLRIKYLLTNN